MVEVKIYPACLKCDCSKFYVSELMQERYYMDADSEIITDNIMECKHERVCKFIDGQEPIEIGKTCTLTYNGEIDGTDAPSWKCDQCGYDANLDTAKFCGGCGAKVEGKIDWKESK